MFLCRYLNISSFILFNIYRVSLNFIILIFAPVEDFLWATILFGELVHARLNSKTILIGMFDF